MLFIISSQYGLFGRINLCILGNCSQGFQSCESKNGITMPPPHSGKTKLKMTSYKALIKNSSLPDKAEASETIKPPFLSSTSCLTEE